ncbi:MAG: hypothetical protein ACRDYF_09040 [Acidimicrobiia bacterium]
MAAIEAAPAAARGGIRSSRFRIVAAFAVGLVAGTSGLATAGALPDGAQEVAHRTLGAVGLNVPHGDRYQGPECGGTFKNHGQYVKSQPKEKRAEAAASRCGKPIQAGTGDDSGDGKAGKAECQGPPPWAGKGKPDEAAKAARKQACGQGQDHTDDKETPGPEAGAKRIAPPTPETSPTTEPSDATSETTATTGATATTMPTTTPTTGAPDITGTTDTTNPTGTTASTAGSEGNTTPSTPVDPPAVGQGS